MRISRIKIKYSKDAAIHEASKQVKRMLKKLEKEYGEHDFFTMEITGIERLDLLDIRFYKKKFMEEVKKELDQDLKNEEGYNDGPDFYYTSKIRWITLSKEFQKIEQFIISHYTNYLVPVKNRPLYINQVIAV